MITDEEMNQVFELFSLERDRRLWEFDLDMDAPMTSEVSRLVDRVLDDFENRIVPGLIGHA